jgi:hypothetical protein
VEGGDARVLRIVRTTPPGLGGADRPAGGGQKSRGLTPPDPTEGASMSVVQTTVTQAKPGRRNDAVAIALEASKLLERHGAADSRLLAAQMAGEVTGTHVFTTTFENAEAWGVFTDSLYADAELDALMTRVESADSPVTMLSMSVGTEIPLGRDGASGEGEIVEAYISRVKPGGFEAACGLAVTVFDFVEGQGATNCQLMQLNSAGAMTECMVASWELPDMKTLGRLADTFGTDPEGQGIAATLFADDSPIVTVSSGIYRVIPL